MSGMNNSIGPFASCPLLLMCANKLYVNALSCILLIYVLIVLFEFAGSSKPCHQRTGLCAGWGLVFLLPGTAADWKTNVKNKLLMPNWNTSARTTAWICTTAHCFSFCPTCTKPNVSRSFFFSSISPLAMFETVAVCWLGSSFAFLSGFVFWLKMRMCYQ